MAQQNYDGSTLSRIQPHASDSSGYVIGADIGGSNLRLALADMTGTIVARWSTSTTEVSDPHVVVALICEGTDMLLHRESLSRDGLRAIAVGAPGITDADRGIVIATSYLMGWRDVPLRALLEAALGVPAYVDNDVNVAAIGESRAGVAQGVGDFVFLAIGTGIGAGVVLNGELFRGSGWIAGEIGYMLVPGVSEAPVERGKPGALEGVAGGEGIQAQWQSRWREGITTLPRDAPASLILDHAQQGDQLAIQILETAARALAYAIYNISLILNCPLIVLGGGVGIHAALGNATRVILEQRSVRVRPRLVKSELGADAQLIGAVFLAVETSRTRLTILGN
jgi:glucokinase